MTGLILAAGRGGRLRGVTGDLPKCLARVGACTLIERQLIALRACGITAVTVVAGYRAADVARLCGSRVHVVCNSRFATTDSLFSFWLARERLRDGFVVLNGDVLFHQQLLADLLSARYEDALLFAARADGTVYSDEEMKVRVRAGRIIDIAKTLDPRSADGESVGIARFGRAGAAHVIDEASRLVAAGATRSWLPAAFAGFCRRRPLHAVETRGFPWIEIDSPDDYWRACGEVLASIDSNGQATLGAEAAPAVRARRAAHHV